MSGEHTIVAALAAKEGQREQHGRTMLTPQLVLTEQLAGSLE